MSDSSPIRRQQCSRCLRPTVTCLCDLCPSLTPQVELVILQHPLETREAKGTGRMTHLSLQGSKLLTGETFLAEEVLNPDRHPLLLYPQQDVAVRNSKSTGADTGVPEVADAGSTQLIVVDATWRKSRKMLHINPWLAALPRLPLSLRHTPQYRIRQAQAAHQLSTLEACCHALTQLEQRANYYTPLLTAFEQFMQRVEQYRPAQSGIDHHSG